MRPSEFANLPQREKALIIAFIDEYEKQKKKENSRIKAASRRKK